MADREGHGQNRQAEGQGNAQEADPDVREGGGQHRAPAAAQDQPKRADEFGGGLSHCSSSPCPPPYFL
jgi:hypothetical protein